MNAKQYFDDYLPGNKRTVFHTKKGLSWRNAWGVLRYSANNAFLSFVHSMQMKEQVCKDFHGKAKVLSATMPSIERHA